MNADKLKTSVEKIGTASKSLYSKMDKAGMLLGWMRDLPKEINPVNALLGKMNDKTRMIIQSLAGAGVAFLELIPILKTFGLTTKAALGWIGVAIAAVTLLYTAWATNFGGIQDSIYSLWDVMVQFFEKTKKWSELLANIFKSLGELIDMVLSGKIKNLGMALTYFFASLSAKLDIEFNRVKNKVLPRINTLFGNGGEEAGKAFADGFKKGMEINLPNKYSDWAKLVKGKAAPELEKNPIANIPEAEKSVFWDYIDMFSEMGDMAQNAFDAIGNSMQMLSDRLTQALFNTKTKFKDLWVAMAMDFTRIFVNYVISQLAKFLAFKVFGTLLNTTIPGSGTIINSVKLINPSAGGNASLGIENQLISLNRNVQKIAPTVNNNISSRQLYNAVKFEREKDLIRRGKDINNNLF